MSHDKDPNQGEGDRRSARRYDRHVREFVAEGKVPDAASEAKDYVEREPEAAERAEREARHGHGGRWVSVEEMIGKGHSVVDRLQRAVEQLRARFSRK
jgi:hypothetical protein